jgi:GT2 family glycosyltransferase
MKIAKGRYIAFIDDDCEASKSWLRMMHKDIVRPGVCAVGGPIKNGGHSILSWSSHILNFSKWMDGQREKFLKDIPTANICYKKDMIANLKFLTTNKLIDYEDTLFNLEAAKKGKLSFCPQSWVIHHYTPDRREFIQKQKKKGASFALRGHIAHGSLGRFVMAFPYIMLLCPRLAFVAGRSFRHLFRFIICSPFLVIGEFVRGTEIIKLSRKRGIAKL